MTPFPKLPKVKEGKEEEDGEEDKLVRCLNKCLTPRDGDIDMQIFGDLLKNHTGKKSKTK